MIRFPHARASFRQMRCLCAASSHKPLNGLDTLGVRCLCAASSADCAVSSRKPLISNDVECACSFPHTPYALRGALGTPARAFAKEI